MLLFFAITLIIGNWQFISEKMLLVQYPCSKLWGTPLKRMGRSYTVLWPLAERISGDVVGGISHLLKVLLYAAIIACRECTDHHPF